MPDTVLKAVGDGQMDRNEKLMLRLEIEEFNTAYAAVVDHGDLRQWPDFFSDAALYRITSRENFDANLPIGVMHCEGRGMLQDRVEAILTSTVFKPRSSIHFIANVQITDFSRSTVSARSNFLIVDSPLDRNPKLVMAGRYADRFVRTDDRLLIAERICVYDTDTIQTSVIYPV